jgi:hypothetical protein
MANQVPPTPWPLASPGWVFWRSGRPATTDGDIAAAIGAGHLADHPRRDALDVDRALGENGPPSLGAVASPTGLRRLCRVLVEAVEREAVLVRQHLALGSASQPAAMVTETMRRERRVGISPRVRWVAQRFPQLPET